MKHLKMLGLVAIAAMALTAFAGGSASATTLSLAGTAQNNAVTIEASLAAGTSAILKDKNGTTNDTCNSSTVKGTTESPFTGPTVTGPIAKTDLTFTGCTHTTHVLSGGKRTIAWASGTNGSVSSSSAEVTVKSTIFGVSAICKTAAGATLGTLTGVSTGHATMHINATTLDCGPLGTSSWTGTYTVTSPTGLGVEN